MNLKTGLIASALLGYVSVGSTTFAGDVTFLGEINYSSFYGYLSYTTPSGERHNLKTEWGMDTKETKLEFSDDVIVNHVTIKASGFPSVRHHCTMHFNHPLTGHHIFEVSGSLFGHWYYWDNVEICR